MARALSLLKAYLTEQIPAEGGYIVAAFFMPESSYGIYEITAYQNVKDIFRTHEGMLFRTDGNRTHILVEPATYSKKYSEPVNRDTGQSIPYRFNELTVFSGQRSERVMIPNEPVYLYSSFTVLEHETEHFAFLFYATGDAHPAMQKFLADSLYNDCNLSRKDALHCAEAALGVIKKFTIFGN